ncbi:MAG: aspartate-semialdehyde dehydrogenase [Bacillota bacterium]
MRSFNVAVVGAAGLVGHKILEVLAERRFPVGGLTLLATARSAGQTVDYQGRKVTIQEARPELFDHVDLVFFAATGSASQNLAPEAVRRGAVVIDKSATFRMTEGVPLVVPEVNPEALDGHQGIIASPNCSTIQMVLVLAPLQRVRPIKRVVVSTYQAVSGTGREAVEELDAQTRDLLSGRPAVAGVYPHQIAFNVLPHIDKFTPDGYTLEEIKMIQEPRKIMSLPDLPITATTARVPTRVGHAEAVNIELTGPLAPEEARTILSAAPGVTVVDDPAANLYPLPVQAAGRDETLVGRIRRDPSVPFGLDLWIVSDNLRKGAATNAVQIAETLVARKRL